MNIRTFAALCLSLSTPQFSLSLSPTRIVCVIGTCDASIGTAKKLSLPRLDDDELVPQDEDSYTHVLKYVPYEYGHLNLKALSLQETPRRDKKSRKVTRTRAKPLFIDLLPAPSSRGTKRATRSDLLVKAVQPKGAIIYDLTAGLAGDALVLANAGASHVHLVERDPIVAALLSDALVRLGIIAKSKENGSELAASLFARLTLHKGDSVQVLRQGARIADVVYIDPMFPPRAKSSAVKKNMQLLHGLLGSQSIDEEEERLLGESEILAVALETAKSRVVVKRPIKADPIVSRAEGRKPSYSIDGSINRWDIYPL